MFIFDPDTDGSGANAFQMLYRFSFKINRQFAKADANKYTEMFENTNSFTYQYSSL